MRPPADKTSFTIRPTAPYDFDLTAGSATYFRGSYGAESLADGVFRRLLDLGDRLCLAQVRGKGSIDSPLLKVELPGSKTAEDATKARPQILRILGTDQDLSGFYKMASGDPALKSLVTSLRGLHIPQAASVFEGLVLAILGQQISSYAARSIRTELIKTYGPQAGFEGITYHAFPRPEAIVTAGVEGLRRIKFSGRKAEYVWGIASRVVSGELDLEGLQAFDDGEVVRRLTSIRGVGMWTAQWLLIRALGRSDGFPYTDLALLRNLEMLAGRPLSPLEALEYSRRWSPFRSYVTGYLFAAVRSGRFAGLFPSTRTKRI